MIKPNLTRGFLATLLLTTGLFAQLELHGEVNPLVRLSVESRYLALPHRFLIIDGEQRGENVSLNFSTAFEYRLGTDDVRLDLREVYVEYINDLGEYRFGKQIHAWGAADGNNPTDNLNPYDFYYMFMPGTDRKLGSVSLSTSLYIGSLTLEAALIPVFQPNRLPMNDPDFPLFDADSNPFGALPVTNLPIEKTTKNTQFGLRVQIPMSLIDVSLSYFRGFDRMPSPRLEIEYMPTVPPVAMPVGVDMQYLPVQVIGADLVAFIGDFAFRAEGAYFITEDADGNLPDIRNPYLQYVLQIDGQGDLMSFTGQYLGTFISGIDGDDVTNPFTGEIITEDYNKKENLVAKMGMPFGAIAQNAMFLMASTEFGDGRYSVGVNALYDFDHGGIVAGARLTMTLEDAFDLECGLTILGGGEDSRTYALKDFSHLSVAMKYSF